MESTMKNLVKPLLMTSMLALPLLGMAHAGPVSDLRDRRDDIRQSLRNHQDDLNTAIQIHDEDGIINARARFRRTRQPPENAETGISWVSGVKPRPCSNLPARAVAS